MDLYGHTVPHKNDLVRYRYRITGTSPQYHTHIYVGIVLWTKDQYAKVLLQTGDARLIHLGDIEVIAKG